MPLVKAITWSSLGLTHLMGSVGHFTGFACDTAVGCLRPPYRPRQILAQCYHLGVTAMPLALVTALFVGMVIVLQTGYELKAFNAKQYAAGGAAVSLTRIMIPIFTALVIGARMAASIAAELGTMRVTEQIDAMEVLDVNPHNYLIVPRVIAAVFMLPIMTLYADLIGLAGGMLMGVFALDVSARHYLTITADFLTLGDVISGLVKPFFYGAAMGLCGCYFGFHAHGGAEGVGRATTRAVVFTLMSLILLEYFLSSWTLYVMDVLLSHHVG